MTIRPRRSALYMPGSNVRAMDKARSLPADAVVLDLEDAVAPDQKESARALVTETILRGGFGDREVVVRINPLESPWGRADLAAVAKARPDAMLLPKVSSPGEVMLAAKELRDAGAPDSLRLWAMMETPMAILNADYIARTAADPASRLAVLVMGTNDLAKETRARQIPGRANMLPWLSTCVLAARAHGLDLLDGVYGNIGDEAGLRAECEQGRDMGMDGKTIIHPSQLAICNEVFTPTESEIAWSRKVIAAFDAPENSGRGAIALEGRLVERLHAEIARRTLAIAAAVSDLAA
jgi:citrate lyase subunit beta/citryl-CoA lyase